MKGRTLPWALVIGLVWEKILAAVHQKKGIQPGKYQRFARPREHLQHFRLKTLFDISFIYACRMRISRWNSCLGFLHSIFLTKKILDVNIPQNRGLKITILPRKVIMPKPSIPMCSPFNFVMFSSKNCPFISNIDHLMA